jgi:pilus assembly protein CpaC
MHRTHTARRLRPWAAILTFGVLALATSHAQPPDAKDPKVPPAPVVVGKDGTLSVPLGGIRVFAPPLEKGEFPLDILVARDDILGARPDPTDPTKILLTGKTGGLTQLTVTRKDKAALKFDVLVEPDLTQLRKLIQRTVPTANIEVQSGIGNVIILSGYVTSPQDANIIERLANSAIGGQASGVINAIQVGGVQQVQIDVVIASVDRNQLRNRGFDFTTNGTDVAFSSVISGLLGVQTATAAVPTFSTNANLQLAVLPNRFFGALQALRTEGVAKFLAEPRVVTQTGRPAFFRAGGQQAILSGTSGITGPGVQLVPFGTEVEVLPIVYGNGQIWLDISPRVTNVSQGLGITVNGANSPGFTEQSVRSTVMLESGQTFAIGGLIQNTVQATASKTPVLGDLPFIGTGFSSVSYQTRESELVILVTPRLVHPMDPCQAPKRLPGQETRTPDDYELFLENILEAPRGQRKVWNGKCYNAAYKCDPTAGKYPCAGNVCYGPNGTCLPANGSAYAPPSLIGSGPLTPTVPAGPAMIAPTVPMIPPSGGVKAAPPPADAPAALPALPAAPTSDPAAAPLPPLPPVSGLPVPN